MPTSLLLIIWFIIEHLSNMLDPLFFTILMHQQIQPSRRQIGKSLLLILFSALWLETAQSHWRQSYAFSLLGYSALLLAYAYKFKGATRFQRFFLPCIGSLIPFIANLLLISFATVWPELLPNTFEPGALRVTMILAYMILSFISYAFVMRRRYQCETFSLREQYEGSAVVMTMILFCTFIFDNIIHLTLTPELARMVILFCLGSACFILYFFASFYRTLQQKDVNSKLYEEMFEAQAEAQNLQHALTTHDLLHDLQHDLGNHFLALRGYVAQGKHDELLRHLNQLSAEFAPTQELLFTDYAGLNAVISAKAWHARQQNIIIERRFAVPSELPLQEAALCAIMGNLLDNAIEACLRLEEPSQRSISLNAYAENGIWHIMISNTHNGNIVYEQGRYHSVKNANRHGRGLVRVAKLVHQIGGSVVFDHDEQSFTATLHLPLVQTATEKAISSPVKA